MITRTPHSDSRQRRELKRHNRVRVRRGKKRRRLRHTHFLALKANRLLEAQHEASKPPVTDFVGRRPDREVPGTQPIAAPLPALEVPVRGMSSHPRLEAPAVRPFHARPTRPLRRAASQSIVRRPFLIFQGSRRFEILNELGTSTGPVVGASNYSPVVLLFTRLLCHGENNTRRSE